MKKVNEILIEGVIDLQKTPGRKDAWVKMQVEQDYFLSLHITKIGGCRIKTTKDAFEVLSARFPSVKAKDKLLTKLFTNITLPPNATDILHVTLGNFPDFRVDRNVANDIDEDKVIRAEKLAGQEVSLTLSGDDFELVATSEQIKEVIMSEGTVERAPTVGFKRDAVLNLKPSEKTQSQLAEYAKQVFGSDYQLWNSRQKPVAYHITIAQTDGMTNALNEIYQKTDDKIIKPIPQFGNPIFEGEKEKAQFTQHNDTQEGEQNKIEL